MKNISLTKYNNILVITGAGISAESGVPTFRGGGKSTVWKGMAFDVISSAEMVREDLPAVWEWFDYRRDKLSVCRPNAAHNALASLEKRAERFLLVTQNIDGLHQLAGSKNVVELHGNINRASCVMCLRKTEIPTASKDNSQSRCTACGSNMRPDVVLFGEQLPEGVFEKAIDFASQADVCLVIGTSSLVYPAAAVPEAAKRYGAALIEINPEETPLSDFCDAVLRGPAAEILPRLVEP